VLRRALPLLGAVALEAIVVVLVALVVISTPLLLSLLVAELGAAVLVVLVLLAVWWLAHALVGWAFTPQEVCLDGSSAVDAVRGARNLVRGNWWRSAILLVTLYVIGIAAGPIVGFAVLFATPLDPRLLDLIGSAIYVVVFPFVAIAATLLFFDLRGRREVAAAPLGPMPR
jgi:hypothetical protein